MKKTKNIVFVLLLIFVFLIGAGCGDKKPTVSPQEVVSIYMKSTLGTLSGSDINYNLAKHYLTKELEKEFTDSSFIPLSYCIQDGPSEVKIDLEKINDRKAKVRVSAKYGEWQEMWEFNLIIEEDKWKINEIICAPFPVTYSNNKYDFSFEYPENWFLEDSPEFGTIFLSNKNEEAPMGGVSLGVRVEIFIIKNNDNLGLEEWVEWNKSQGGPEEELIRSKEINLGDKKAIKEVIAAQPGPVEQGNPIIVYMTDGNSVIQINYTGREPDYSQELLNFENLLESFSF